MSAQRSGVANATGRARRWDTRVGSLILNAPRVRDGGYFPSLLAPRRRAERATENIAATTQIDDTTPTSTEESNVIEGAYASHASQRGRQACADRGMKGVRAHHEGHETSSQLPSQLSLFDDSTSDPRRITDSVPEKLNSDNELQSGRGRAA